MSAQELPRAAPERPKSGPRAPQERPRALQERPRSPRDAPADLLRRPAVPSGSIFRPGSSKKCSFESDPSRDSLEKRLRSDFRMIFEAFAQTPNLDFEATLQRFLRFFKHHVVFE